MQCRTIIGHLVALATTAATLTTTFESADNTVLKVGTMSGRMDRTEPGGANAKPHWHSPVGL